MPTSKTNPPIVKSSRFASPMDYIKVTGKLAGWIIGWVALLCVLLKVHDILTKVHTVESADFSMLLFIVGHLAIFLGVLWFASKIIDHKNYPTATMIDFAKKTILSGGLIIAGGLFSVTLSNLLPLHPSLMFFAASLFGSAGEIVSYFGISMLIIGAIFGVIGLFTGSKKTPYPQS